jgi:DNA-binding NarL/FixJ family response regulator
MKKEIRVALADDHALLRQGMCSLLQDAVNITVVASVGSGEEAVNIANDISPDVFLMDIVMRGMTGIESARWIKEQNPQTKIILISGEVNKDYISEGIKMGIDGYLPKDTDKETLIDAINMVVGGEKFFSPEIKALIFRDFYLKETEGKGLPGKKSTVLSKREEEVLALIAGGKDIKEVGEHLFISPKTVETHKMHIQDKLGLKNTAQLVRYAIEKGLVHNGSIGQ